VIRTLIMAKAPIPGTVKTRLQIAPEDAARLQAAFIRDTVAKAWLIGPVTLAGAPPDRLDLISRLLPPDVALIPQPEGDLGQRMSSGAATLFEQQPGSVLILGTDAPTLTIHAIQEAANALTSNDVSIIQSVDGGYVLLGLRELHEDVFDGIEWSTEAVYRQTLERARDAGFSVWEGEPWYDVDTPQDLVRLANDVLANPEVAPRTAQVVKRLRA
jgi:rSAM/selenodomain-associated transferase 1